MPESPTHAPLTVYAPKSAQDPAPTLIGRRRINKAIAWANIAQALNEGCTISARLRMALEEVQVEIGEALRELAELQEASGQPGDAESILHDETPIAALEGAAYCCRECLDARERNVPPWERTTAKCMIGCPECGNKRCPRTYSCRNRCSGSNASGQVGVPIAPAQDGAGAHRNPEPADS